MSQRFSFPIQSVSLFASTRSRIKSQIIVVLVFIHFFLHISQHFVSVEDPLIFVPRDLFDEYRDMRLDVDNMSYEVSSFCLNYVLPYLG